MTAIKVVITGAESTGKSTLAETLSRFYGAPWVPELARTRIESLNRPYTYSDIEDIAKAQTEEEKQFNSGLVFFDTWLIITKVWFDFVYGHHPDWLDRYLGQSSVDLFLLCDIDLPWVADPLRENGGENRKKLQQLYISELEKLNAKVKLISGIEQVRFDCARTAVDDLLANRMLR